MNNYLSKIEKEFDELFELKEKEIKIYQRLVDEGIEPDLASHLAEEEYKNRELFIHLYSQQLIKEIVEEIEGMKCKVPLNKRIGKTLSERNVNQAILYAGRFNYNKALDDLKSRIEEMVGADKKE